MVIDIRMLDENFQDQMEEIIKLSPGGRQTMLFSATMTDEVKYNVMVQWTNLLNVANEQFLKFCSLRNRSESACRACSTRLRCISFGAVFKALSKVCDCDCYALWLAQKSRASFSANEKQDQNRSHLVRAIFRRFAQVSGNCKEFWLVHRALCCCCDWSE